jgi:response regulator RpfG family c-di-GMP phosphodiesterase
VAGEKILIVDDEENIQHLCTEILSRQNYIPVAVGTPHRALDRVRDERFDLLLTDINMPEMDGLRLLQAVREIQHEMPAVIITGHGTLDKAIESLHLGAQGFLVKPFTHQELLQVIAEALERNRLLRENMRLKLLMPLFEISQNFLSETDPDNLVQQIAKVAQQETGSDGAMLMLRTESDLVLRAEAPAGVSGEQVRAFLRSQAQNVVRTTEPLVLLESANKNVDLAAEMGKSGLGSVIAMPLSSKGEALGVLALYKRTATVSYNQSDIELITILSGQAMVAIENARLFENLQRAHLESMKALAQAIEAKDHYTRGHCDRMVDYSLAIADHLGLSPEEKKQLSYAAALHDIGKIGVHEAILNKSGKLTESEYAAMKGHPAMGAEIVKGVEFLGPVVPMIYYHQERWDGKGYPDGLKGKGIPIGARIVAVLDTFDAMTSDRPYRKALPVEMAFAELRRCSGTQFDPEVVESLVKIFRELQEKPRSHSHP